MTDSKQLPPPLLVVVGPTASGKTDLGIYLARMLGGEVVSGDAFQVYKDMSIGTAKPTPEEMQGIPHHLIDILPASASYSLDAYLKDARAAIEEIHYKKRLPILCGGTGLYISSLMDGRILGEAGASSAIRDELCAFAAREGNEALHRYLQELDPGAATALHPNNLGRIVRAIEAFRLTGLCQSERHARSLPDDPPYTLCIIGLTADERSFLYSRIDQRVDKMIDTGLIDEAKMLRQSNWSREAAAAIGYKELMPYIDGECGLDSCVANIKQATRRYAKRQLTWFKRDGRICWLQIDALEPQELHRAALDIISQNEAFARAARGFIRKESGCEQVF